MHKNTGMYPGQFHFMQHGLNRMDIKFIDQHRIIVVEVFFQFLTNLAGEKKGLVVEIDLFEHKQKYSRAPLVEDVSNNFAS